MNQDIENLKKTSGELKALASMLYGMILGLDKQIQELESKNQ